MVPSLAGLGQEQRALAEGRWQVLRPHVQDGVPLARVACDAQVPLRAAQRWLVRYRAGGLAALARPSRSDRGVRRTPQELVRLVEGLALRRPRPSVATVARQAALAAAENGWPAPSYSTVHAIVNGLDPQLVTLAHDGPTALRDRYELVHRRQSDRPNALWQADHTELDLLVLDADGTPAGPWLSVVLDDCSRAVAGYSLFLGAPSTLKLSLALRQAIWRKTDPTWAVHRLPDVLYADHGSDFTSDHLAAVTADLHIELVHSAVARPQGRSKIEQFSAPSPPNCCPSCPGQLVRGRPVSPARLTLPEADAALGRWITGSYHQRIHGETGQAPQQAWVADGWLPRILGQPRAARPAARPGRQAAGRAPRRHPLTRPALPRPDPGRLRRRASHHPLRPAGPRRDPSVPPRPVPVPAISPERAGQTLTPSAGSPAATSAQSTACSYRSNASCGSTTSPSSPATSSRPPAAPSSSATHSPTGLRHLPLEVTLLVVIGLCLVEDCSWTRPVGRNEPRRVVGASGGGRWGGTADQVPR